MLDRKNNKHPQLTKIYMENGVLVGAKGRLKDFIKFVAFEINLKGQMR